MKKVIYVDNAATTSVSQSVINAMLPCYTEFYGNPSSVYSVGLEAEKLINEARNLVAQAIDCEPNEVFFTSGGSESDNWAIKGIAKRMLAKGKNHIITTAVEHHAVLHSCQALEREGFEVTYLPVDEYGMVSAKQVEDAVTEKTSLVTVMYANNEIGTIMPIAAIGEVCRKKGVVFHTDAVQAVGHIHVSFKNDNIDMLSLSAHKFNGPKGVGCLIVKKGVLPNILIDGGAQERGRRAGTENVAGIVGLGVAITEAVKEIDEETKKLTVFRDKLIENITKLPYTRLNGHPTKRLPGNVNISIQGIEGEALLLSLDNVGICASSGSACTSGSLDPSHVLLAIGLPHEIAHGSLRISLGNNNTMEDVDTILKELPIIVDRLRAMSPVWEDMMKNNK